ncbi:hypothetical protein [Thalassomonas sp. RHCl1]|uniref:hypothetical protein n=1 Tax=Thalassomonas sp. RHCl1 TaxID=2995320 RepID=UPI00248CC5E8|nr:hypothetical protein [Thalassomonas sp. RHCl1]
MLNRRYTAVILSLVVHGILLLLLLTMTTRLPQPEPVTKPAIKSYLYTPKPEIKVLAVPATPSEPIAKKEQLKKPLPPANKKEDLPAKKVPVIDKAPPVFTDKKQQNEATTVEPTNTTKNPGKDSKTPKKFSARNQLQRLTNSINNQMLQEGIHQYQQHKSPSVMHGEQQPVPHSKKTIDAEQKKADNTTEYSQGMSITKHDDGTCSVTEDLSNVGMEGLSATQSFNCGISKEEKYFKEHMKNVLKKLGK